MTPSSHHNNNINVIKVKRFAGTYSQFEKGTPGRKTRPGVVLLVSLREEA